VNGISNGGLAKYVPGSSSIANSVGRGRDPGGSVGPEPDDVGGPAGDDGVLDAAAGAVPVGAIGPGVGAAAVQAARSDADTIKDAETAKPRITRGSPGRSGS
jgi:hypothetical protein